MVSLEAAHGNEATFLKYLEDQSIKYEKFSHPVVLTVEEQAKHVGSSDDALVKNLLLKDKKGRLILVSALTSTPVDLKLLSQRLGLGKGGLRMAPLENLGAVLQVPEGSVTPLALFHQTARTVPLLLDKGLKAQSRILVHPLVNDSTIALDLEAFEAFLRSIGREANYVDLEAVVAVGKDQPPDLAPLLQGAAAGEAAAAPNGAAGGAAPVSAASATTAAPVVREGAGTSGQSASKAKTSAAPGAPKAQARQGPPGDDVAACAEGILNLLRADAVMAEADAETPAEPRHVLLREELSHILVMFKNAAYTQGFTAAKAAASLKA